MANPLAVGFPDDCGEPSEELDFATPHHRSSIMAPVNAGIREALVKRSVLDFVRSLRLPGFKRKGNLENLPTNDPDIGVIFLG